LNKGDGCSSEADGGWMSFDHLITMIDHFKLNVGSANAYMTLELPKLHRLWIKSSWWV
jgi:hypothetical protein